MSDDPNRIEFTAEVVRIRTMADGGLRFELGVGEDCIMQAAQLMECKRFGVAVKVVAEPLTTSEDDVREIEEGNGHPGTISRRAAKKRKR